MKQIRYNNTQLGIVSLHKNTIRKETDMGVAAIVICSLAIAIMVGIPVKAILIDIQGNK